MVLLDKIRLLGLLETFAEWHSAAAHALSAAAENYCAGGSSRGQCARENRSGRSTQDQILEAEASFCTASSQDNIDEALSLGSKSSQLPTRPHHEMNP